jgi:hypothetical protein
MGHLGGSTSIGIGLKDVISSPINLEDLEVGSELPIRSIRSIGYYIDTFKRGALVSGRLLLQAVVV